MIQFDLPKERSSIIKVIGVGGGGSNAVNHMFGQNIEGCNFIIRNNKIDYFDVLSKHVVDCIFPSTAYADHFNDGRSSFR